ncbi:hypothetical protein ACFO5Q_13835 [Kordiimonas lipolytica]|uniref:Polyketide cyclase / dehydrase and lipid transport n=1 Tax=Kordiimonas lipolytica TaxID=1662421 RepID=A0ABV8UDG6_9PROT|nr:hypothetical protein [Kordiimonas lipolytica]
MDRKVKDRFRDWNLLHKSVVALIAAFFVSVAYRAVIVIDSAFEVQQEAVLPYAAETIWPWIYTPERRSNWQAWQIDYAPYMGAPDKVESTRLARWKKEYKRWHAVERTTEVVQARVYATVQESDKDTRWFRVELTPEGPCSTRVRLYDMVRPKGYEERFWFFTSLDDEQKRVDASLKALDRWVDGTSEGCATTEE